MRTRLNSGVTRLLIRPAPRQGELLAGYLGRVMQCNGAPLPLQWASWFPPDCDFWGTVSALGLDIEATGQLIGLVPIRQRLLLPAGLIEADVHQLYLRWCPQCLSEHDTYLGAWALKLMTTCIYHRARLVDICPSCKQHVRLTWAGTGYCPCGGKLREGPTTPISQPALWLGECLTHALSGRASVSPYPFSEMGIAHWLRLIRYLGPFGLDIDPRRPGQLAQAHLLSTSVPLTDACAELLVNWPTHFDQLLKRLMHRGAPSVSMQRTFGRLYRVLYQDLADQEFGFLRKAFEAYLAENWWGLLGKHNRQLSPTLRQSMLSKNRSVIRGETGVSPKQLDWLIE